MPFEGQTRVCLGHSLAIVDDLHTRFAGICHNDLNTRGAGVDCIFHQLLN